jgi:contractile injection system tube protein
VSAPLVKAELWPLKQPKGDAKRLVLDKDRPKVVVQFNPASLKIERRSNTARGGLTANAQHRQYPSAEPATLSFDLEFDTAEGDANGQPQDVRDLTKPVRQFVEPPDTKTGEPPPRVCFIWGTFSFVGIVTQVTEDLDYFSATGMPLRAKLSLSITEQDLKFEQDAKGAGARDANNATSPGGGPANTGPAAPPDPNPVQSVTAQAGESVQQLLARSGADPAAWRTAMAGPAGQFESPLALPPGQEVLLGAQASAGGGIGISAGFAVQADTSAAASLAGALGVNAAAAVSSTGVPAVVVAAGGSAQAAGFALAAGGGIAASLSTVLSAQVEAAAAQARASFEVPAAPATARPTTGGPGAAGPAVDPRALSYGRSIPLQAKAQAATVASATAGGRESVTARAASAEVPVASGTDQAPWERLPPSPPDRLSTGGWQRGRDARPATMRWKPGR